MDDKWGGFSIIRGCDFFLSWKICCGFEDFFFMRLRFIWFNKCEGEDLILECFDRVFVFLDWVVVC